MAPPRYNPSSEEVKQGAKYRDDYMEDSTSGSSWRRYSAPGSHTSYTVFDVMMERQGKVVANIAVNNDSDMRNPSPRERDDRLQRLYLQRLQDFAVPIKRLLLDPIAVFHEFVAQEIAVVLRPTGIEKKWMIQNSPFLSEQVAIFFSQILLQTNFKEVLRAERAFSRSCKKGCQEEIIAIFASIIDDLEVEANAPIRFLAPIIEPTGFSHAADRPLLPPLARAASDNDDVDAKSLRSRLHNVLIVAGNGCRLVNFLQKPGVNDRDVWLTENDNTPLHSAARSRYSQWAKEFADIILSAHEDSWNCPLRPWELINFQNKQNNMPLHLAVENQSCQLAQCLIAKGADVLVRNDHGVTPLELMYEKTSEIVIHVLNLAIHPAEEVSRDGSLPFELDFRAVIGGSRNPPKTKTNQVHRSTSIGVAEQNALIDSNNKNTSLHQEITPAPKLLEMDLLAKMVYHKNFQNSASVILQHVIVKIFLHLKWKKLQWPMHFLTLFYVLVYGLFNIFAIEIFILKYPYVTPQNQGTFVVWKSVGVYRNRTFWKYFTGIWLTEPGTVMVARDDHDALVGPIVAAILMLLGAIYVLIQLCEFYLIWQVTGGTGREAFCAYFARAENFLQFFFSIGTFLVVGSVNFRNESRLDYWTYWVAAWLIMVSWMLVRLQFSYTWVDGKYVYMFKTVIRRFSYAMISFFGWLYGFSIAFSILIPQDRFATFPMSFFRSISMMAGELNFDEVFDPQRIQPFPFAAQALYFVFTVAMTIVLINLLTALTVDDVRQILKESEIIHRSVKIERLYILERMLHNWLSDIYVLPAERRAIGSTLVFLNTRATRRMKITDLPEELQKDLSMLLP